jgi:hypothetical protein
MLKQGIDNNAYHGSGELSRSTAWSLINTCPAKVRHDINNPKPSSPALVIGSGFHTCYIGTGKIG